MSHRDRGSNDSPYHYHLHHPQTRYYTSPPQPQPPPHTPPPPLHLHHHNFFDPHGAAAVPPPPQPSPQTQFRPPPPLPSLRPPPPPPYHHHHHHQQQQQPQQQQQLVQFPFSRNPNNQSRNPDLLIPQNYHQRSHFEREFPAQLPKLNQHLPPSHESPPVVNTFRAPPPPQPRVFVDSDSHTYRNQHNRFDASNSNHSTNNRVRFVEEYERTQDRERDRERGRDREKYTFEFVGNGDRDAGRVSSRNREYYYRRERNLEVERVRGEDGNGNGCASDNREFNRVTPGKEMQKKSVLLRLQKPISSSTSGKWNRDDDRRYFSGQFGDAKPGGGSFKGKDQNLQLNGGVREDIQEEKRVKSPFELDVSFKSNSLVAKPIAMTPSSSSAGTASGSDSTPKNNRVSADSTSRNSKVRRVLLSAKDKPDEGNLKSKKPVHSVGNLSGSDCVEDAKQSKGHVTTTCIGNVAHDSLKPSSSGTWVTVARKKVEGSDDSTLNKDEMNAASGKKPLLRLVTKKKIVKKVVKRAVNEKPCSLISHPEKINSNVKEDNVASDTPTPSAIDKCDDMSPVDTVHLQPCPRSTPVLPYNDKVEGVVESTEKGKLGSGVVSDPDLLCVPNLMDYSTSPLGSSSYEENKCNERLCKGNFVDDTCVVSNTNIDFSEPPKEMINNDSASFEDVGKLLSQIGGSSNVQSSINSGPLSSGDIDIGNPTRSCQTETVLDKELTHAQGGSNDPNIRTVDVGCEQPCIDHQSLSLENYVTGEFQNASFPLSVEKVLHSSDSGETIMQNAATLADCHSPERASRSRSENGYSSSQENETSSIVRGDNSGKKPSPDAFTAALEDASAVDVPNHVVSMGHDEGNVCNAMINNRHVEAPQLDIFSPEVTETIFEPVKTTSSACWVDTTLRLSFKSPSTMEVPASGDGTSLTGILEENNGSSHRNEKKRKFLELEFCGSTSHKINDQFVVSGFSTSGVDDPSREEVAAPSMVSLGTDNLPHLQREVKALDKSISTELIDGLADDGMKDAYSSSTVQELSIVDLQAGGSTTPSNVGSILQNITMDVENVERGKMDTDPFDEQVNIEHETHQHPISSVLSPGLDGRLQSTIMEHDKFPAVENDLPSMLKNPSKENANGLLSTKSCGEPVEFVAPRHTGPDMDSSEISLNLSSASCRETPAEKVSEDGNMSVKKLAIQGSSNLSRHTAVLGDANSLSNRYDTVRGDCSITEKAGHLSSQGSKATTQTLSGTTCELHGRRNLPVNATSKINASLSLSSKTTAPLAHVSKPRTWHRTGNSYDSTQLGNKIISRTLPAQRSSNEKVTMFHSTSYVRKGNSLVRKPSPATVQSQGSRSLNSLVSHPDSASLDRRKKNMGPEGRKDVLDLMKSDNSLDDGTASPLPEFLHAGSSEAVSEPAKFMQSTDVSTPTSLKILGSPMVESSNGHNAECEGLHSDGYYKRRKNQLVRAPVERHLKLSDESSNPDSHLATDVISRKSSKKRLHKVISKTRKPSKSSLVWSLNGTVSSADDKAASYRKKFLPHLFPWKRATNWSAFIPSSAININNSSSSLISKKLLMLRKRDAVYTRSKNGFSLHKTKVLSVGGSSLKWSKSIERRSKKANEEATLAVVEAERKKKEHGSVAARKKKSNNSPRERIFRIGSVRYKMDSSRRTLQRISDDESSSEALRVGKDARRSYVPRRLVIGKNEYVRIGNGNQLVRDPKKRARVLASEKVRWSLHTARSRLARKRKYCLFFTKYGKCNKGNGKCPYIHDASKIAVCTKFLNGLCSNSNCKLTHKVIPERMPDCSYYLQGLCNNGSCPYRHVHVNPKAPPCDEFLRGYCADGNECRKKHSYICPVYEETGSCPQGSKCKLHHPKSRSKGKKAKRSRQMKNTQGRYFGSMHVNSISDPCTEAFEKKYYAIVYGEMGAADFIALDVSDEEAGDFMNSRDEAAVFSDDNSSASELGSLNEVIKPIRIMNI